MSSGDAADALIEDVLKSASFSADGESEARSRFLSRAFALAASDLTRRDAAFALALCAPDADIAAATSSLVAGYHSLEAHVFLGPELLHALSLLAERDAGARRETVGILLRMRESGMRYLLVRAAKVAGRMEASAPTTLLCGKLEEWSEADDPAVSAEALFQLALLSLGDALRSEDLAALAVRLVEIRASFERAERSEELRVDARLYLALVDLFLSFLEMDGTLQRDEVIAGRARRMIALVDDRRIRPWHGYASRAEEVVEYRLLSVARCFEAISAAASRMEEWTNFDASLAEVAALYTLLLLGGDEESAVLGGSSMRRVAEVAVSPRLGPLLTRSVSRRRFARVIENLESRGGDDGAVTALRTLRDAAYAHEYQGAEAALPPNVAGLLRTAVKDEQALRFFFFSLPPEARAILVAEGAESSHDTPPATPDVALPLDHAGCYGDDPAVDETVRNVLGEARGRLAGLKRPIWNRFVEVTVFLVQSVVAIRDLAPVYTLCEEDAGLGRRAGEEHLQQDLYARLQVKFGRTTCNELQPMAGGRVDLALKFIDCEIPIEVKATLNIEREHIRENFLKQADDYASERDRLCVLMILDLRAQNSDRHLARRRAGRRSAKGAGTQRAEPPATKIYSVRDSFWIDGLPGDPQITGPESNAVLVGLIPGNRAKPSSSTVYSSI